MKVFHSALPAMLLLAITAMPGCEDHHLVRLEGSLRVTVLNVDAAASLVQVSLQTSAGFRETGDDVIGPETELEVHGLPPGAWDTNVATLNTRGSQLQAVMVSDVLIRTGETTEIIVNFGEPVGPCDPDTREDLPLCTECSEDGKIVASADDERCGVIDCSAFEWFELRGPNDAAGESLCVRGQTQDITTYRCAGPGQCVEASADLCETGEVVVATAGLCHTIEECESGAAEVLVSPDGTPCGDERICQSGNCVGENPEVGCADGTREGFLSLQDYPSIAGCSGAWDIGGITRPDLAPACGHNTGNDSDNPEGTACSAADLCAPGWHVCLGKDEVARHSPDGCGGAVPPGTPDKALFFAVLQNSRADSVCDDSDQGNDVFGCGNLGTLLAPDKNCQPLNRVLASMHAGSCGFNEAEPPLGPWVCSGESDSHLHEGTLVRKSGCSGMSCSYDGNPVGNSDKGGVLCCVD